MVDFGELDHPIWHALSGAHAALARSAGGARRYPGDVSPLSALKDPRPESFADLRSLIEPGGRAALFAAEPVEVPPGWEVMRARPMDQMVCTRLSPAVSIPHVVLQSADVPQMLALTAATEPGPFLRGTISMGRYIGIRSDDGWLVAMAGQRLRLNGFTEISAVCTDPAFRGRGYAAALITVLVSEILAEGKIPFLHVLAENNAKAVYQKLGFVLRRPIRLTAIVPQ